MRTGPPSSPLAWIWDCRLESRYEAEGAARHLAVLNAENLGLEQITISLPPGVTRDDVRGVWVDETRVACPAGPEEDSNSLAVMLPPGRRFPVVSIHFVTNDRRLGLFHSIAPPLPGADVPVLRRQWIVWLPAGYEAASLGSSTHGPRRPSPGVFDRLLGPLGRGVESGAFAPRATEDWATIAGENPGPSAARSQAERFLEQLPADWIAYRLDLSEGETARLSILHRTAIQSFGWTAILTTFAVTWWLGRRVAVWIILAGLFGLLAVWVPEVYGTVFSGAMWGVLGGCLFRGVCCAHALSVEAGKPRPTKAPRGPGLPIAEGRLLAWIVAALAIGASPAAAQEPTPVAPPYRRRCTKYSSPSTTVKSR